MDPVKLLEALVHLESVKDDLPLGDVEEKHIIHYHEILTSLARTTGFDLTTFYVPHGSLDYQRSSSLNEELERVSHDSDERYCDRSVLLMRLDALIKFFAYQTRETEKRPIGFAPPR